MGERKEKGFGKERWEKGLEREKRIGVESN